jgi:glycosyltransferase involved in cell wall biosynthesis
MPELRGRDTGTAGEPLVSILVPAYSERFLAEALRSALAQTYSRFELIVCNDNPGSGIAELVEAFDDDRITYYEHSRNGGAVENYKKCFDLASGTYVKFLNDDDLLHADCVGSMVACLETYGQAVTLVTSRRLRIDESGRPLPDNSATTPLVERDARIHGRDLGNFVLRHFANVIGEPTTVMFRRADLASNQPDIFSVNGQPYGMNVDVAMWLALLRLGDCIYLASPLSCLRRHEAQESFAPANRFGLVEAWPRLCRDAIGAGYLADPESRARAAESARALLIRELGRGAYTPEQTSRLEELLLQANADLSEAEWSESAPSVREEIYRVRRTSGWLPPVRYVHLPGSVSRRPWGLGSCLRAWRERRSYRRRRRKRERRQRASRVAAPR